ncbi:endothelin-3 [Austrofundulus limnaeus]|uniref:Endothelin-3 n=1 Tax=Austrofundulus limnaeus TaxID=52670 RepID=A0A2I4BU65_AUSLI|nr:PREDICTED: endothelin-3-like [Austrofundulus limnaeus]
MTKMQFFLERSMLFITLALILLQGVSLSHVSHSKSLPDSKVFGSRGSADPHLPDTAKPRQKRCTCYSYKDKECVYYCHLDIIWINTPERTVPYGMSSYRGPQRRRRAADGRVSQRDWTTAPRCVCAGTETDPDCWVFCQLSPRQSVLTRSLRRVPGLG